MGKVKEKRIFKKGERYHLDDIYIWQGLGGNDWWESEEKEGDKIVITSNIIIEVIITR